MRHPLRLFLALACVAVACKERSQETAPQATRPAPAAAFTMRDLARATALDARLARWSVAAGELEAMLAEQAGRSAPVAERAARLRLDLAAAGVEAEAVVAAIAHPLDRPLAERAVAAARRYEGRLVAALDEATPAARAEALAAREGLGAAISAYRASRSRWRLEAPVPQGAEREFTESRRVLEMAEAQLGSPVPVAPREGGHELDPASVRMNARMAVERAKASAASLPPTTRDAAVRWAAAQERVLAAVTALSEAPDARKTQAARAYQAAKADALLALADYFAALAAR